MLFVFKNGNLLARCFIANNSMALNLHAVFVVNFHCWQGRCHINPPGRVGSIGLEGRVGVNGLRFAGVGSVEGTGSKRSIVPMMVVSAGLLGGGLSS